MIRIFQSRFVCSKATELVLPRNVLGEYRYPLANHHSKIRVSSTTCRVGQLGFCSQTLVYPTCKPVYVNNLLNLYHTSGNTEVSLKLEERNMPKKKEFQRLPKTVKPLHYDLYLKPNLKTFVFEGRETVVITVNSATKNIILNCADLDIKKAELISRSGELFVPKVNSIPDEETIDLEFDRMVPEGKATLHFEFVGELNDKMKGFYRSNVSSSDGEPNYAAVTQFEATDARRCFPCWDEPAIKAKFEVTLCVPQDKVALSNMPVIKETTNSDGTKTVRFECSPLMSTYLVAVVVGDFDYVEDKTTDGRVTVRVYTPVGVKDQGRFALYVATKVLPYYSDYFRVDYPLPKIDLVAIADFSAGAMENWGLVTYRQSYLLVDKENTSASRKQMIALIVGHELAHQWFGNLVTMEWWTHLWLNEGYATFVENLCVAHLFPEYDIWTQFVFDMYIKALELDCLKNSHPIEVPVGHPSEIDEIFDDISYNKGASVIRMLHRYIGDNDFRLGMNKYLTRHTYANTFTEDLWAALEEMSKKPVRAVMSTWTKQKGFPLIRVTENRQVGNNRVLTITQEKFPADPLSNKGDDEESSGLWMVPLNFSVEGGGDTVHETMLTERSSKVTLPNVGPSAWVKINPGTVGFYRTSYPPDMLQSLVPAIQNKSLPPLDRLGIVDDLFALVQTGQIETIQVLQVIAAMEGEDNYTVWSSITNFLSKLEVIVSYIDYEKEFKTFSRKLLKPIGDKLGWVPKPNESHVDTLLRTLVLSRLGWYSDNDVLKEAKRRFEDHSTSVAVIPADLRSAVYKSVLSVGNEDTFNSILKLYRDEKLQEEKDRIYRVLGAVGDASVLEKVLDFAMSDEVRSQDKVFVIISVAMTKAGRKLAWELIKNSWQHLFEKYNGGFLLSRLVKHTTENFVTEDMAVEVDDFFKSLEVNTIERTVQQSVESIRLNAAWLQRDQEQIKQFLDQYR